MASNFGDIWTPTVLQYLEAEIMQGPGIRWPIQVGAREQDGNLIFRRVAGTPPTIEREAEKAPRERRQRKIRLRSMDT